MRYDLGKPKSVAGGDLVTITASLPRSAREFDRARIGVYSRVGVYQFSPHTDTALLGVSKDGKPLMVHPMFTTLHSARKVHVFEFYADEAMDVIVKQEKDDVSETSATIRIKARGKIAQAFGRLCRDAFGSLRRMSPIFSEARERDRVV
jgi:hypothetical protein